MSGKRAAEGKAEALQGLASGGERAARGAWQGHRHCSQRSATKRSPPLFLVSFFLEKNDLQKRTSTHTQVGLNEIEIVSRHIRQSKYK